MEPIGELGFSSTSATCLLVFVIFDVETVFLYPWAVAFHTLGLLAFVEALFLLQFLSLPSSTHGAKEPWNESLTRRPKTLPGAAKANYQPNCAALSNSRTF